MTYLALFLLLAADLSPARYRDHVKYLASEKLKGRGNDLPELQEAARYVAKQFQSCGLQPVNRNWFQKFTATVGSTSGPANRLAGFTVGKDFQPLGISDSGPFSAPLVFAGYGITAEDYRYDDYAGLDVKGKAVLVLRHEPQENDEKSVFAGKQMTRHADIIQKALNARSHGAVAMILVNDPLNHADDNDPFVPLDALMGPEKLGILTLQVKRAVADQWLKTSGQSLEQLQTAIDKDLSNRSIALHAAVEGQTDITRRTRELENVAGVMPGRDPKLKDQFIVIGAHYDHLGLGGKNSLAPSQTGSIHYGADDNASGTAGVIELACAMKGSRPARTILFLAFSGEEMGLLGSAHYTKAPLFPLEQTVAMINLDMIGRPKDKKIYVGGVGTAQELKPWLEEVNKNVGMKLEYSNSGYGASDHTSFNSRQIPVLFFFSGLHGDYHKPSDTWEKIDAESATQVLALVQGVVKQLDARQDKLAYIRVAEPPRPVAGAGGGGYGAYFGSIPDMGESQNGVRFSDVRPGSPADKAGLKGGDVLIAFDAETINNLEDFTFSLRKRKPGDLVKVTVMRGKEKLVVDVTLGRRN